MTWFCYFCKAKTDEIMKWKSLRVEVSWRTMDPGVVHCDGVHTDVERSDLKVGQYVGYDDPSDLFSSIKVLEISDTNLKIEVGGRQYLMKPDYWVRLGEAGRDYTNFYFDAYLMPLGSPDDVEVDGPEHILRMARNRYEVFALSEAQIEKLKHSNDKYDQYLLGRWYWLTIPEKDAEAKAETLFRQSADAGCADALFSLAQFYRFGVMHPVDLDEYVRLRDEARSKGSLYAEIFYCVDVTNGIACEADPPKAITLIEERIKAEENPDPEWYDALGWAFFKNGQKDKAAKMFSVSVKKGYSKAYEGYLCVSATRELIIKARKAGCGFAYLFDLDGESEDFDTASEVQKETYHAVLENNYETALLLGQTLGAYYLADAYYKGTYGFPKDDQLAWKYAYRGGELADSLCYALLSEMITDGRAPKEFGQDEADFFLLQSLRNGNSDVLNEVVELYDQGRLQKFADEIERYYIPLYEEQFEPEDDDGRWDAYV
jgi:TPR repeat protein